ncbi:MAG TPA: hypothetical protein VJZ27_03705, partial [Aggregatilineales bacterium]|nr:hypothetical protein [Aggregatilineales bacterium]
IHAGYFDSISLDRPRLIAQVLNNLSAAAVNGFVLEEVTQRLISSWSGHSSRLPVYRAAMEAAQGFRHYCLQHVLLDFSLQIEFFMRHLVLQEEYIHYAHSTYRYLIMDNAEENFPVTLDFINGLWQSLDDGLVVYDRDAGFRVFLGASPEQAYSLKSVCDDVVETDTIFHQDQSVANLADAVRHNFSDDATLPEYDVSPLNAFTIAYKTFYPEMVDWIGSTVIQLVRSGVSPREIVILAPFLGDSLRFSLYNQLELAKIPFVSHRPSRAIRDEPAARAVLTFMKLAYPAWEELPPRSDVAQMFVEFIDGLDPIRAELLAQIVYKPNRDLSSFDVINAQMQSRITYSVGERYEKLRLWIEAFHQEAAATPPDHFMRRIFDLVSQPGYRFHVNLDAGRVVSQLIDSANHFRDVILHEDIQNWDDVAVEYIKLVGDGVLASVNLPSWLDEHQEAVFIAPATTFLMRNRFVDYQFWVDVGSNSWFERLEQPVTHPYVLRREYPAGKPWTDEDEVNAQTAVMEHLLLGLMRRCRKQLFLGFADLGEQGFEQRGPLLRLFNRVLGIYGS